MPPKKSAVKSKEKDKENGKDKDDKLKSPSKNGKSSKPKTPDAKSKSKKGKDKDKDKKKKSAKGKKGDSDNEEDQKDIKKRLSLKDLGNMLLKLCTCCSAGKVKKDYWAPFVRDKKNSADLRAAREESSRVAEEERQQQLNYDRLRYLAAVRIQSLVRGVMGRTRAQEMWRYAMDSALVYWEDFWYRRWMATQQDMEAKTVRQRAVNDFVRHSIAEGALMFMLRSNASTVIQKMWRGYSTRLLGLLDHRPKRWKKRVVPSRFSLDVYRRIWGRSVYMPLGGWPGRKDTIQYDMWEHAYQPPRGRAFGLRTKKVIAAPRSEREKQLLMHDPNAWVGVPIAWEEGERGPMDALKLAEAMAGSTTPGFEARLSKLRSDVRLAEEEEDEQSQALSLEALAAGAGSRPREKQNLLDELLLSSPYKHPVIHPPGYVPLNPDELLASFGGPMNMAKDKALFQDRQVMRPATYDAAWLERSVEAQDKARRAEKMARKKTAAAELRNAGFRDAMRTYRGVLNEVTGEYSLTSELTGSSAISHLLMAKDQWNSHGATEPAERNFGQVVTDAQGLHPIVQATPLRGTRKPMTERHRVSLDIERTKAAEHRERILAAKVERLLTGEGVRTGAEAAEEDEVLNAEPEEPPDAHTVLLGRFGHKNHLMSKRSQKIIDHSRWSLVQHRSHRAAQAEHNAKRNSLNAHATAADLFNKGGGDSRSRVTGGAGTVSVLTGGEFSLATARSDAISVGGAGTARDAAVSPSKLVKGSAMDGDDFDDETAKNKKRKPKDKGTERDPSKSPSKRDRSASPSKRDRSASPSRKTADRTGGHSPSPSRSRAGARSRSASPSASARQKEKSRKGQQSPSRSPSRSPSPNHKRKKGDRKFVSGAKGGSQITFTGESAPGSDWTEVKEDVPAEKRRERQEALEAQRRAEQEAEQSLSMSAPLGLTDAEAEAIMGYWTSSPWGQLKQQTADEIERAGGLEPVMPFADDAGLQRRTLYKPPKQVQSKVRVWPVRPRQHYKLRYSWLPAPMVNRAAIAVHDPQAAHRTPLAPVGAESSVYLAPGSAQSQASLSAGSARSSPVSWAHGGAPALSNIDEEELTVATNLMDGALGDGDSTMGDGDRASPPVRYIQHDVGGQRWTSIASENKVLGGADGRSSSDNGGGFSKPHAVSAIRAANGDERGRARERVRVKSSSHRGDAKLRDAARRMQRSPAAAVDKRGLRNSLKKRHAYVELSSDEEDDEDTGARSSRLMTNVNTSVHSPAHRVPYSVGGDQDSVRLSLSQSQSQSDLQSFSTLPTASQFSGTGASRSFSVGGSASGTRSTKRPRRRREVQSNDEFQFAEAEASYDGSAGSAERSDIFDPAYYDKRGHVVPKARRSGPTALLLSGRGNDSPEKQEEKLHPYEWL